MGWRQKLAGVYRRWRTHLRGWRDERQGSQSPPGPPVRGGYITFLHELHR